MTRNSSVFTLIGAFALLFGSSVVAQDISLNHLDNSAFVADVVSVDNNVRFGGRLPSDFVKPTAKVAGGDAAEENFAKNVAVLIGFASLLALGGAIVGYVGFVRRRARTMTPMQMVHAG